MRLNTSAMYEKALKYCYIYSPACGGLHFIVKFSQCSQNILLNIIHSALGCQPYRISLTKLRYLTLSQHLALE